MASKKDLTQGTLASTAVPEMPEGYYSGDKPNPTLRAFVDRHMATHPYDPATDSYDVPAFDRSIDTTKATAIYNMHTYWSKKPHDAIRQYIAHYTQPSDLVLDPFCGSGSTALAALMEGRAAIAIDRSPAATFITKNYCTPVDTRALQQAFEELKARVKPEIDWLYETRCDRCDGKATTGYTVYSQVFQCPRCLNKVPLFDCTEVEGLAKNGAQKQIRACPHCHALGNVEEISTRSKTFGAEPVLVSYLCQSGCKPARGERKHNDPDARKRDYFQRYDLAKIAEIETKPIPHWYPDIEMIRGQETCAKRDLAAQGIHRVSDLFTKRNLWALAAILQGIRSENVPVTQDALLFIVTSMCLFVTKMHQDNSGTGGNITKGTYYLPPIFKDMQVWDAYARKASTITIGLGSATQQYRSKKLAISTQSATDIGRLLTHSVDFIFTDPPYADKVQYGELNFVWEAWLGLDTHWHDEEIIVNDVRGKSEADWAFMMRKAMAECYRVLKPGRWLSLCYHDTAEGTWALVQDIMAEAGFLSDNGEGALYIDTGQKSYNQLTADKVTKRDLVINFRKPRLGEIGGIAITGLEDPTTFAEKVRTIIRDYLSIHPGETKDRIYDEVVSKMVRAGLMEAHNFDELLAQVAEETVEVHGRSRGSEGLADARSTYEIHRWYLKDSEDEAVDAAQSAKEDRAAAVLRTAIEARMVADPDLDGMHYSDLFERYVYGVKDKSRRELADWLLDYFFRTPSGGYRPPQSAEEEQAKVTARAAGVNRRVKRYLAYIKQGVAIPERERQSPATLVEWVRQCKRTGLYEEGKHLYEQGGLTLDGLSEEQQVEVEEDYGTCVRMLARTAAAPKAKRGKK